MAKKKTAESPTPETGSETAPAAAPRRRRTTTAKTATTPAASPDVANDRAAAMPEPTAQRVTPADASESDSVTFVSLTVTTPSYEEIAEAAYHRYLNRGGSDGRDFEDWIEAEKSLKIR